MGDGVTYKGEKENAPLVQKGVRKYTEYSPWEAAKAAASDAVDKADDLLTKSSAAARETNAGKAIIGAQDALVGKVEKAARGNEEYSNQEQRQKGGYGGN